MIRTLLPLCLLLAGPLAAQPINVRSGAHENFARLVLDVPSGTAWSLQKSATGAELTIDGHSGGFNTSSIFDRIDQSFIASVSASESSINVEFSCACDAIVFDERSGMIVLDVSTKRLVEEDAPITNPPLDFVGGQALRFQLTPNTSQAPRIQSAEFALNPRSVSSAYRDLGNRTQRVPPPQESPSPDVNQLRAAREQIVRQIGTAATRGLLSSVGPRTTSQNLPVRPQIDPRVFETTAGDEVLPEPDQGSSTNIKISNSSTLRTNVKSALTEPDSDGLVCIDPQRVNVQSWGTKDSLSQRTSRLRSQLFGEFDQLDQKAALELARTYIYFGFGAEARQILLLDRNLRADNPELLGMTAILEFGHSPDSEYLSRFMECDSDAALWAILSVDEIEPTTSLNVTAALRSASALPMHLRNFIAPELSRRLLTYGDPDSAAAALRSLERAPNPPNSNANLAKAEIELSEGRTELAQGRLAEIVTSNTEQSATALIKFVDSHLAEDSQIDADVATLVEAYAKEMRGHPLEIELRRTHVLALGKSGQFSEAFDALSRMRERNANMPEDPLRSSVLELLTASAEDVEFLEHAFVQIEVAPDTLTPRSRFRTAQRLAKLGFAQQAEMVLNSGQGYSKREQVGLLRAEISLSLDRPYQALAHLFGLDSEPASLLRAKAEASAGDFSSANSIYTELGISHLSQRTAWLSQDWSLRVENATPVFGPMVSIAQSPLDNQSQKEGMLGRAAAAISESENARAAIRELLKADPIRALGTE